MFNPLFLLSAISLSLPVLAAPRPSPAQAYTTPTAVPTLPAIIYNIPGILDSKLIPILGEGSDGGIEVGGIGEHTTPSGIIYEHGTGDLQIGPGGVEVCLTQTFVVGVCFLRVFLFRWYRWIIDAFDAQPMSLAYGVAVGAPSPCTPLPAAPTQ